MNSLAIQRDVPLAPRCTLELGGAAKYWVSAASEDDVRRAIEWAERVQVPWTILGSGSNVVVRDAGFPGLVVSMAMRGVESVLDGERVMVTVAAGEPWDEFVDHCVAQRWAGIECLSGIPGLAGATPIQNVGAYGQDVAETIRSVRVYQPAAREVVTLTAAQCAFDYRSSAFKRREGAAADAVVLSMLFALRRDGASTVCYPELSRALDARGASTLRDVREAVIALRRTKSMVIDPADPNRRSVGSFFMNPIVSRSQADDVVRRATVRGDGNVPQFDAPDGRVKLAAAWLIEKSGFAKGERRGAVGISSKHALALVHHGGGTTAELLALADAIQQRVWDTFAVTLQREPVVIPGGVMSATSAA